MKIKIPTLNCQRCEHGWVPRQSDVRQCPRCKSIWWDVPKDKELMKRRLDQAMHQARQRIRPAPATP